MTDCERLQDAITQARAGGPYAIWTGHPMWNWAKERNALCDVLQAILDRHTLCDCPDVDCIPCRVKWPCPDVLTVETALRNMGAL